jgi:hypothetical protein
VSFDLFSRLHMLGSIRILLLVSVTSLCSKSAFSTDRAADALSVINNHFSDLSHAQLMESADQFRIEGRYQESEGIFKQLFDSVRANSGLFHEQQFVVLDRLIHINLLRTDWQSLKQHIDYHDWLGNRLYADSPQQLSEHLQNNASYHELAARAVTGPARNWHLVQTRHQLWRAVSALETLPGESDRLPPILHRIAMHHYALSRQGDLRWLTSFETRSDEPAMISGWALQGNEVSKRSYEVGAELISRIVRHYEMNPHREQTVQATLMAQLIAYRGDWELLFERDRNAIAFYDKSLDVTRNTSCPELMAKMLFENPVELPLPTLPLETEICNASQNAGANTPQPQNISSAIQAVHRPRRSHNQWLMAAPLPALSAIDTENSHD